MKAIEEKSTVTSGNAQQEKTFPLINKPATVSKTEAIKKEMKPASPVERILNNLEVLLSRRDNRGLLLESLKKLKAFDPGITESQCKLIIQDKHTKFETTSSEAMKL